MRKIILLAALFATPALSAPKFGNAGGVGSINSTYVGGEPSGGKFSINGTTGLAGFTGVGSTATAPTFTSDFFNPGDSFAVAGNLLRATDTATGTGKIQFDTLIDNIVASSRINGPAQASVSLGIRSLKPDFLTSTSTQELDGIYAQTATGLHGDTTVYLGAAKGVTGGDSFVNFIEGTASLVSSTTSLPTRVIRFQAAAFDQQHSTAFGAHIYAQQGVSDVGLLIDGASSSDYFTNFVYASKAGTLQWQVDGIGNENLTGSINAPHANFLLANGTFTGSPNYVGSLSDSATVAISGSPTSPDSTQGATGLFQKSSYATAFNGLAGTAYKASATANTRATGVYGEGTDPVGGLTSFVEGGRFQGTLTGGANGSAYGAICSAGTTTSGPTTPAYLIGCEGEVDNQIGPDAPTYGSFNQDRFSASFVATNGAGSGTRYKADAAFVVNHYSLGKFRTGLLLTDAVTDTGIAAKSGSSLVNGIDLHLATISFATLVAPNNVPIRFENAGGTAGLNVVNVDASNVLQVGTDVSKVNVPTVLAATSYSVGSTAGASCSAGTVNLATMVVTNGIVTHC